jgi:peptidoglycan/LPS O-acetylase OafA/YrhL
LLLAAKDFKPKVGLAFVAVGATIVILSLYYWFIVHAGFGLIYGGIIILMQNKVKIRKIVDTPFLVWVGERSYSLFLTHLSVFYLVNNIVSRFTTERNLAYAILTRGIGIPLSVFVAMLLFQFVERFQAKGVVTAQYFWPWQAKRLKHDLANEVVKLEVKEEIHQQPILNNV